jgi:NADPH:quinone reductase-like Zn-dependent oxidoreductase
MTAPSPSMRAIVLERHGSPSVLRVSQVASPQPSGDQVAVRIEAIGLNYAEILSRKGLYGWAPRLPYILGMEACGTIDAVGPEADPRRIGERVLVTRQHGCYAERVVVRGQLALPAIAGFSVEENAAFPVQFMTAWVAFFEMARLRASDRVWVTAAAGGVGTAAVQIAKKFGCAVIAGVGSDEKFDLVKGLGADVAINYRRPGFEDELRRATDGKGVDVALEVVGGEVFRATLRQLAPFGRIVVVGFAGLDLQKWNPLSWYRTWRDMPRARFMRLLKGSNGFLATHLGYLMADPQRLLETWTALTAFVRAHGIRPIVGQTFAFDQMAEAHRLIESRHSTGKVVVRV